MAELAVTVLVFALFFFAFRVFTRLQKEKEETRRRVEEMKSWHMEARKKKVEWNKKIRSAKHLLESAKNWRDPEGKEDFLRELYGGVPQYLFYEISRDLTDEEVQKIVLFFWGDEGGSFGDLERHNSLRVRNAKRFTALLLEEFPLIQAGHCQAWETTDEDGFPEGVVLFSAEGFYPKA
ncbi:MAG: hypothetical protein PHH17_02335 [Candidatus Pacebacteria bacterium]|jgi:hypothetical protein|nr:hypothetical protein [Candidatus Paceibacterota bacterium]MDD3072223.1 hypothetical protein [Candidatus Paceibacterota bacterium]MDD4201180.1 hypothetical protein [Candidatus Paceibacterota bacterium]MDD4897243.1 hypothetical protein [Candidatus Paceibacterota bacterium]MDD5446018.1 hypothetical protein [Candidatus Paceibacterota bacterium]